MYFLYFYTVYQQSIYDNERYSRKYKIKPTVLFTVPTLYDAYIQL